MPRIVQGVEERRRIRYPELITDLADELRTKRESGQPVIREQHFPRTNAIRVTVIWDKWEGVPDEDRVATILHAYEQVEGGDFRDRIALVIGLTVPEATESGLLPVQVTTALRKDDPVTLEQCRDAMIAEGASILSDPSKPKLRFATVEEAEACVKRLVERLPGSDPVWVIAQEGPRLAS